MVLGTWVQGYLGTLIRAEKLHPQRRCAITAPLPKLTIKPPVSLRDRVYTQLKEQIVRGHISSSMVLTEISLAEQIGISRTPVREALHYLEKEGLIESLPKKGYRVRRISRSEIEEICEIRISLESLAIKWAIERISPSQIKALQNNIEAAEKEIAAGDVLSYLKLDALFHEMVAEASGSSKLSALIVSLRNDMVRTRIAGMTKDGIKRALNGHRQILEAIVGKNTINGELVIRGHLEDLKNDMKLDEEVH
jgi:GntR family transcriptional regulator, rspAB operon transcriptional repressor